MYAIGNDHTGVALKDLIKKHLEEKGETVKDFGTESTTASNYPDIAETVANAVASGECERAVLICGTGLGMSIAANKVHGIRAVCCSDAFSAKMSKEHNNANVAVFGARTQLKDDVVKYLTTFLNTSFSNGERHCRRIEQLG